MMFLTANHHVRKYGHEVEPPTIEQWNRKCGPPLSTSRQPSQIEDPTSSMPARARRASRRDPSNYTFKFGRHYRRSIREVLSRFPGYIAWLVEQRIYMQRRRWDLRNALLAVGVLQLGDGDLVVTGPRFPAGRRNWRRIAKPVPDEIHFCSKCGVWGHNVTTCAEGESRMMARLRYASAKVDRKRRKLMYSGVRKKFARQKSRMKLVCNGDDFASLSLPDTLQKCVSDGLLESVASISDHPAFRRFSNGHGCLSMRKVLRAHWHVAHGKSIADIRCATGVSEASIRRIRIHGLGAIYLDTLDLQSQIRFGGMATQTVTIEGDEKLFISRSELDGMGNVVHRMRGYIAFIERGDCKNPAFPCRFQIWVRAMPLHESHQAEKRVKPLDVEFCEKCLSDIGVSDGANIILMTDGGENSESAYAICARRNAGIVQHETVCHGQRQYARSCLVRDRKLPDGSWTYKKSCAGDQLIEGAWRVLETHVPS